MTNANSGSCRRSHKARGEVIPDVFKFDDGTTVIGHLHDNKKSGRWMTFYPEGDIHEGMYEEGVLQGPGKWVLKNGDVEYGSYKDNEKHGVWHEEFGDATYTYNYVSGNRDGSHTYHSKDGSVQQGLLTENNRREGWWTLLDPSGRLTVGEYRDHQKQGLWTDRDPCGRTHEAMYVDNDRTSPWKVTKPSGSVYEGNYDENALKNGHWTEKNKNGNFHWGDYKKDQRHGCWYETCPDGTYDRGYYRFGQRHGPWIFIRRGVDGFKSIDAGEFKNGQRHGLWKKQSADGCYEREYREDLRHGPSKYVKASGTTIEGRYCFGRKMGIFTLTLNDESTPLRFFDSPNGSRIIVDEDVPANLNAIQRLTSYDVLKQGDVVKKDASDRVETPVPLEGQHEGPLKGTLTVSGTNEGSQEGQRHTSSSLSDPSSRRSMPKEAKPSLDSKRSRRPSPPSRQTVSTKKDTRK